MNSNNLRKEKYPSKSKEIYSFAFKLSLSMFINSAIIQFIIAIYFLHNFSGGGLIFYKSGGLITNQFTLFFTMSIINILLQAIHPRYLIRILKRKNEVKKGSSSFITQTEANTLFEDPEFKIGEAYAKTIKFVLFTAFYSFILPMGIVIMIIYLVIIYWLYKVYFV